MEIRGDVHLASKARDAWKPKVEQGHHSQVPSPQPGASPSATVPLSLCGAEGQVTPSVNILPPVHGWNPGRGACLLHARPVLCH